MNKLNRIAYSSKHIRRMKLFERQFLRPVYDALQDQIRPVVDVLKDRGIDAAISAVDRVVINTAITPVLLDMYEVVGLWQARKATAEINRSVRAREEKAIPGGFGINELLLAIINAYFKNFLLQTVLDITNTSKGQILAVLQQAQREGWGVDKTAIELESSDLTLWRARLITRTETAKANYAGQLAAEQESEWELDKTWIAANDHRTRHSHRVVDDVTIDMQQKFKVPIYKVIGADRSQGIRGVEMQVGVDLMGGPGDDTASIGNLANCRCTYAHRAKRDENGRLIRKRNISIPLVSEAV